MTLKNRLEHRKLVEQARDSKGRDTLLLKTFSDGQRGLMQQRLDSIRQHPGTLYEKGFFAAEVLFESLVELGVPIIDICAQFTVENLAALVYEEWSNPVSHRKNLETSIRTKHSSDLSERIKSTNFKDLSNIQLFRERIAHNGVQLYQGNLYQARLSWKNFQPSNEDFLLNRFIPKKIGVTEAVLLGIYWSEGYLRKGKDSLSLILNGRQPEFDIEDRINMYGHLVVPLLRRVHNYEPVSADSYIKERKRKSGNDSYRPSVEINSAAVCTWLRDDLGYPPQQRTKGAYVAKRVPFQHLGKLKEIKQGFFAGLVAGLGILHSEETLLFEHVDKQFIEDIAELSKMLGYDPSQTNHRDYEKSHGYPTKSPIWHFTLPREDVDKILETDIDTELPHAGLFFNPRHYKNLTIQPTL